MRDCMRKKKIGPKMCRFLNSFFFLHFKNLSIFVLVYFIKHNLQGGAEVLGHSIA